MSGHISLQAKAFEYWRSNPVEWVKDWFKVTPEEYQGDVLLDTFVRGQDRTVMKSAHGVGKSTTLSWAGLFFLNMWPMSRVVATAPTKSQLTDILWPEYAKWLQKAPAEISAMWDVSGTYIRNKEAPNVWFAVNRTSNKPANLQGFHADNILVQVDEGSAVPPDVFEVIEGILSDAEKEGGTSKLLMAGNPNFNAGEFFNAFNKNKALYNRYTVTGDATTKFTEIDGKTYVSKRVTAKYRHNMTAKYGAMSAVYDVRVRGIFPKDDDRAVISLASALSATMIELPHFDSLNDPFHLVMDVARFGGDETTCGAFRRGHCLWIKAWPKTSTEQCVDILLEEKKMLEMQGFSVSRITIDEPGVGGGVVDSARRMGLHITPYNGGGSMLDSVDPAEDIRMFANKRSRDWWYVRRQLELKLRHIPDDEVTVNQLASVMYDYNDRDKIKVESKKEMRERLGDDASPDRADTIIMGMAPWYSMPEGVIPDIDSNDILEGEDRERFEMELS